MDRDSSSGDNSPLSRRRFLKNTAVIGAVAWVPAMRIGPAHADASCPPPPNFPPHVELFQQTFENWAKAIRVDDLWTAAPRTAQECADLANWAASNGWQLRPRGAMHNWSPIHITADTTCDSKILMVSTTDYLTDMSMLPGNPATVRVEAGAFMEDLLGYLETRGYGMCNVPAPGDVTVGGALAVDAHGTAIPAAGEQRQAGHSYGTLSNLLLSITAVVWDRRANQYVLRRFERDQRNAGVLATSLGRSFITEVEFQVGHNQNLRCQSFTDIPYTELMAAPGCGGRSFASFLEQSGRAEIIWFPFTDKPWLKVWSVAPTKPLASRQVSEPYNYPFSDNMPDDIEALARSLSQGNKASTPVFGQNMYAVTTAGLTATQSTDIWGPSKNTLLYIKPTTLRITASGYGVMTRRDNIQQVVYDVTQKYLAMVADYESRGEYPMNMPVEIRVNGLEQAGEVEAADPAMPLLSAASPDRERPDWDVVVWFNCLSFVGTEQADAFYSEMEQWFGQRFDGSDAAVRPEWSKGWGYNPEGAWTNDAYLDSVADSYRLHRDKRERWDYAVRRFDKLDPYRVFTNGFIDRLLR